VIHHGEMNPERDPMTRHFPIWDPRDLSTVIVAIRAELTVGADRAVSPSLDEFLGAMESWLASYPQPYVDGGTSVEDVSGRLFADALLAAASGGELTSRWYSSIEFDEVGVGRAVGRYMRWFAGTRRTHESGPAQRKCRRHPKGRTAVRLMLPKEIAGAPKVVASTRKPSGS
jgi:hypothetical protein